jgi:hypothetical protein
MERGRALRRLINEAAESSADDDGDPDPTLMGLVYPAELARLRIPGRKELVLELLQAAAVAVDGVEAPTMAEIVGWQVAATQCMAEADRAWLKDWRVAV